MVASASPPTLWGSSVVVLAAGLGAIRYAGGSPAERGVEGALAAAALAAVVAGPGLLTLLARHGRPSLLVAAGVTLVPLSLLSFAGLTLPLLIPAGALLVSARRHRGTAPAPCAPAGFTTLVVVVLTAAATVALFAHDDPRAWETATGGGWTGDVVTVAESLLSLGLTTLTLATAWYLSTPVAAPPAPAARGPAAVGT